MCEMTKQFYNCSFAGPAILEHFFKIQDKASIGVLLKPHMCVDRKETWQV